MEKGNSRFKTERVIPIGLIAAHTPTTTSRLKILDPMTLLSASSFWASMAAVMLTEASGMLVPNATTVSPMMTLGIRRSLAILELPSTK